LKALAIETMIETSRLLRASVVISPMKLRSILSVSIGRWASLLSEE